MPSFAVVVLAAGGSSRLGRPKQLVKLGGKTLVLRAVERAMASGASQTIVALGAAAEQIRPEIEPDVDIVVNRDWSTGIAGSIRLGVNTVRADIEAVVLVLCDMPGITPDLIARLADRLDGVAVAATEYGGLLGVPAAFRRSEFPALLGLTGDEGARKLLRGVAGVAAVPFDGDVLDVDTPDDVAALDGWAPTSSADRGFR